MWHLVFAFEETDETKSNEEMYSKATANNTDDHTVKQINATITFIPPIKEDQCSILRHCREPFL